MSARKLYSIMEQEEQHIETFKASGFGIGMPTLVHITDTDWDIQVDEPTEDGGSNKGPNPMQYFVAALAGCQNEQAKLVAEELSINMAKIDIEVEVDLDLSGFMGMKSSSEGSYKQVRLKATVHGDLNEDQVKNLGDRVDARCPILALLRSSGCEIHSDWIISED